MTPTPPERLRQAFSGGIPENLMDAPEPSTPASSRMRSTMSDHEDDAFARPDLERETPFGQAKPAGQPVLRIVQGNEIVHSDLNALITGPGKGRFPAGTFRANPTEPDREQPFREFTVVYHDEIKAVQAFPQFNDKLKNPSTGEYDIDNPLAHTLHSSRRLRHQLRDGRHRL